MTKPLIIDGEEKQSGKKTISSTLILFIFLVVMVAAFAVLSRDFYSIYNITSMLTNIAFSGIVAGTLTMVMIMGGLDISIGGNIALTSCLVAYLYNLENAPPVGIIIIIGLALGTAIGTFNGFIITRLDLNPIITTLGTMAITRGMGYVLTKSRSILIFENVVGFIGRGTIAKLPFPLILFIIIYAVLTLVMGRSKFGRKVYCIGTNQEAARLSGIAVNKVKFIAYLVSGIAASLSGLILTGQSAVGMPQHATGVELDVITAVLLGGTSLAGGRGSVLGTLAGVLILGVLYNGFTMIGFRYVHIRVFQGVILILVVALYEIREKRAY
ncbi:MAG: ABC transporter permease [Spirochaetes bacterium]|nr:ABC transporter permease [Spirochaetota bacterium]